MEKIPMIEPRTTATRIKDLEAYAIRHGELIQELMTEVEEVKKVQRAQELKDVREEGAWAAVLTKLTAFDVRLGKIEGIGNRATAVFFLAILAAFITFVVKGGLAP